MSVAKRGSIYRARIRDETGKEHSRNFKTRREALLWESEQRTAKAKGQFVNPGDRTTVAEYAKRWEMGRPFRTSTRRLSLIHI